MQRKHEMFMFAVFRNTYVGCMLVPACIHVQIVNNECSVILGYIIL